MRQGRRGRESWTYARQAPPSATQSIAVLIEAEVDEVERRGDRVGEEEALGEAGDGVRRLDRELGSAASVLHFCRVSCVTWRRERERDEGKQRASTERVRGERGASSPSLLERTTHDLDLNAGLSGLALLL